MTFTSTVRSLNRKYSKHLFLYIAMNLGLGFSLAALVVPKPVTVATESTGGVYVLEGRQIGEISPMKKVNTCGLTALMSEQ